jgi:pimeloyl-ACP methyl ester carboxylesterase
MKVVTVIDLPGHGGLRLLADDVGPADGPKVLMLHGGGQTRFSWGTASRDLAADGLRCIALDSRGHGESDWDPAAQYSPQSMALDVASVIEALGAPVIVVGASLGGLTGIVAAADLGPDVIPGLVLVDVVPQVRTEGSKRIQAFMTGSPDGFADLEEAADAIAAYLPHRPRPTNLDGLRKNLRQRPDGRWVWHWDPAMMAAAPDSEHQVDLKIRRSMIDDAASRLRIPLVLVRGLLSDVVDDEGIELLRALAPQLEVYDLEGAAHTAAADDNDGFAAVVGDFVRRLTGTGRPVS